ncbi:hypothetical protein CA984_12670 [Streptosporangium minutum]|uniref:Uncharacterized protein n=1 Tax=Streptosporangium minutum TaxID=569862 RepID=A0A243RQ58_9ACTN|nr:hypothetical protein CA984_12670 [Streptosporangium minutum]
MPVNEREAVAPCSTVRWMSWWWSLLFAGWSFRSLQRPVSYLTRWSSSLTMTSPAGGVKSTNSFWGVTLTVPAFSVWAESERLAGSARTVPGSSWPDWSALPTGLRTPLQTPDSSTSPVTATLPPGAK